MTLTGPAISVVPSYDIILTQAGNCIRGYDLALMLLKDKKLENNVLYLGFHDDVLHYKSAMTHQIIDASKSTGCRGC